MTLKKWFCGALLALVMLLPLSGALAAEAMDITGECALRCSPNSIPSKNLTDGKYTTKAKLKKVKHPWVSISAPAGVPWACARRRTPGNPSGRCSPRLPAGTRP